MDELKFELFVILFCGVILSVSFLGANYLKMYFDFSWWWSFLGLIFFECVSICALLWTVESNKHY